MTFLLIQMLFFWAFLHFYGLCRQEMLMIPSKVTLVSKAKSVQLSSKQWHLLKLITMPLGLICLLNFTYLGYATFKDFDHVSLISLFFVVLSIIVLGLAIYSDQNLSIGTQNKKE